MSFIPSYRLTLSCLISIILCLCLLNKAIANGAPKDPIISTHPAENNSHTSITRHSDTNSDKFIRQSINSERNPQAPSTNDSDTDSEEYSKNNLQAQQNMAKATWWIVGLGFCEIILLGLAVFFAWRAAIYAKSAADIARDDLALGRRPYIGIERASSDIIYDLDRRITHGKIDLFIKNAGSTPALECEIWSNTACFEGEIPENFDYPSKGGDSFSTGIILPNSFMNYTILVHREKIEQILAGTQQFYYWGEIRYKNFLNRDETRRTFFCSVVRPRNREALRNTLALFDANADRPVAAPPQYPSNPFLSIPCGRNTCD